MSVSGTAKGIFITLAALVALAAGALGVAAWSLGGEPGEGEPLTFTVDKGASAASIAASLAEQDVVRSSLAFRLKARSRGLDRRLEAGTYDLETGMSVDEAIDAFLGGPQAPDSIRFTIPEGLTVEQTLERLADQTPHTLEDYRSVLDARELELPPWMPDLGSFPAGVDEPYEGLLYPETYEVKQEAGAGDILQRMIDQLATVVEQVGTGDAVAAASQLDLDRYETLILASLVEEEAQVAAERATIAGVIVNRLEADRALEVDASNLYAAGFKGRATSEVRNIDSPYNLYQHTGLPPTPISSPGRAAIEAAFAPEDTAFLYYVKKNERGEHAFAETFEEHQRNVARFRELQRQTPESPSPAATGQ